MLTLSAKKTGLSLGLLLLLVLQLLLLALPARAEEDENLYEAPFFNAQNTPLLMMGTQSFLIGASENYLAWYVDNGTTRSVFGFDRPRNKMVTAGSGPNTTKPAFSGNTIYYFTGNTINAFDIATEKQNPIATKSGVSQIAAADGGLVAYIAGGKGFAVSGGAELAIDLVTSAAANLSVSGKNVFWTGQTPIIPDDPTNIEYAIYYYNLDKKATAEALRTQEPFLEMVSSGNTNLVYSFKNKDENNAIEVLFYNIETKKFEGVGNGGGASISSNLVVYLTGVTNGRVAGYDLNSKKYFAVTSSANETYIFGNRVIWRKDFSNKQGKGRTYYEALLVTNPPPAQRPSQPVGIEPSEGVIYFEQTAHTLQGIFKNYWEKNGGLAQFGFPLTEEFNELNPADGKTYKVQYFERARFEFHPENKPPYNVLLGLLGKQLTIGREYEEPFLGISREQAGDNYFFQETGHAISGPIRTYWEKTGGLPVYGFPITEPFNEVNSADGKTYLVQYFERNRLEYHPENAGTKYEVLLGLLGNQTIKPRGWLD